MMSFISLATRLYRQVQSAAPDTRDTIVSALRDAADSGMVPLGVRGGEYVWVVFDRSRLRGAFGDEYRLRNTPSGVPMRIIEI